MSQRTLIVAEQFSANSFVETLAPIADGWLPVFEIGFPEHTGIFLYQEDQTQLNCTSNILPLEFQMMITDIDSDGWDPVGGMSNIAFLHEIDKICEMLGTTKCTYICAFYDHKNKTKKILDKIEQFLRQNYSVHTMETPTMCGSKE